MAHNGEVVSYQGTSSLHVARFAKRSEADAVGIVRQSIARIVAQRPPSLNHSSALGESDESFNDAFDPNSPLAEQVPCPRACLQPSMRMH